MWIFHIKSSVNMLIRNAILIGVTHYFALKINIYPGKICDASRCLKSIRKKLTLYTARNLENAAVLEVLEKVLSSPFDHIERPK